VCVRVYVGMTCLLGVHDLVLPLIHNEKLLEMQSGTISWTSLV
jgi:hypothetical protein